MAVKSQSLNMKKRGRSFIGAIVQYNVEIREMKLINQNDYVNRIVIFSNYYRLARLTVKWYKLSCFTIRRQNSEVQRNLKTSIVRL